MKTRETHESSVKRYLTVSKSLRTFSNLAVDQSHEQNNKPIKVDRGAIGILENEATHLKWSVAGPMLSDILKAADLFENKPNEVYDYHGDIKLFQKKLYNDK